MDHDVIEARYVGRHTVWLRFRDATHTRCASLLVHPDRLDRIDAPHAAGR